MVIEYLSPSKIHFINECKLQYVLSLSEGINKGPKIFNKNTFLGILMHSVLEQYLKRKCSPDDFHNLWEELFNKMINDYEFDFKDVEIIKYHLPFYEVKKNKLLQLLCSNDFSVKGYNFDQEKNISGGFVKGTVDMVFENQSEKKVKIIDFKTGPIASYANGEKQEVKRGYLFQLMTYGYIYWLDGYLPENISCALQGVSISEYEEMAFTHEEYKNHEKLLLRLKTDINQAVTEEKIDSLANPSPKACMYCNFNSSCATLHNSMDSEINYTSMALIHQINSEFNDVESKINIITNGGKVTIYKIPTGTFISLKHLVKEGKSIFVSGLFDQEQVSIKYWTRYTSYNAL